MAQLKNIGRALSQEIHCTVTVGHNRQIERVSESGYRFRLHGHAIAWVKIESAGFALVELDHCGFKTTTTRAAMNDAMKAFGVSGSVSFANGGFGVRYKNGAGNYMEKECTRGRETINFRAARYI